MQSLKKIITIISMMISFVAISSAGQNRSAVAKCPGDPLVARWYSVNMDGLSCTGTWSESAVSYPVTIADQSSPASKNYGDTSAWVPGTYNVSYTCPNANGNVSPSTAYLIIKNDSTCACGSGSSASQCSCLDPGATERYFDDETRWECPSGFTSSGSGPTMTCGRSTYVRVCGAAAYDNLFFKKAHALLNCRWESDDILWESPISYTANLYKCRTPASAVGPAAPASANLQFK